MKLALAALCCLGLASFARWAATAEASGPPNGAPAPFRDGVILMAFENDVSPQRQAQIIRRLGATEIKRIGVGVHVLAVPPGLVRGGIQRLLTQSEVRYAEPDFLQTLDAGTPPNDASFGNQWAALNTGQKV